MADITFIGFVDEWTKNNPQHPDWAMRVSEPHRKKDGDNWVTVSRTNRTVKAAFDVKIDFTQFAKGDRVAITGKEVTETSEKDGKRYDNLVVKAEKVEVISPAAPAKATQFTPPTDWAAVDPNAPF
jgi:hypothetical protein